MRSRRRLPVPVLVVLAFVALLAGCGSSSSKDTAVAPGSGSAGTELAGTEVAVGLPECSEITTAFAKSIVNWQIVIGLAAKDDVSTWSTITLGTLDDFGDQLALLRRGLASDAKAMEAIGFMSGANDIVQKGRAGDATAADELDAYLGTDTKALILRQLDISSGFPAAGC